MNECSVKISLVGLCLRPVNIPEATSLRGYSNCVLYYIIKCLSDTKCVY